MKFATSVALVFVTAVVCQAAVIDKKEKLKVALYYESLCPGCQAFTETQLLPVTKELGEHFDLHLYPFGNAEFSGNNDKIVCQHGPEECVGNRIHACGIQMLHGVKKRVKFIACMDFNSGNFTEATLNCSASVGLDAKKVEHCANGKEGLRLVTKIGHETLALKPTNPFVPMVSIDGYRGEASDQYSNFQDKIETNFLSVVCQELKKKAHITPKVCQKEEAFETDVKVSPCYSKLFLIENEV